MSKNEKLTILVEWVDLLKNLQEKCNELEVPHFVIESKTQSLETKDIQLLLNDPEHKTMVLITTRKCKFDGSLFGISNIIYFKYTKYRKYGIEKKIMFLFKL